MNKPQTFLCFSFLHTVLMQNKSPVHCMTLLALKKKATYMCMKKYRRDAPIDNGGYF